MEESILQIERRVEDGAEIFELRGELDLSSAQLLEQALAATSTRDVILDLSGLSFLDSAGIRTIDQAHRLLEEGERALHIVAASDSRAAWTFRVAGFGAGIVLESVEDVRLQATQEVPG
jgi:anti-anti-sigma factor